MGLFDLLRGLAPAAAQQLARNAWMASADAPPSWRLAPPGNDAPDLSGPMPSPDRFDGPESSSPTLLPDGPGPSFDDIHAQLLAGMNSRIGPEHLALNPDNWTPMAPSLSSIPPRFAIARNGSWYAADPTDAALDFGTPTLPFGAIGASSPPSFTLGSQEANTESSVGDPNPFDQPTDKQPNGEEKVAQALFPPLVEFFLQKPPIFPIPPEALKPLDQLPPGSAGGETAGKPFPRAYNDKPEGTPCQYCGQPTTREPGPSQFNGDHIQPRSQGGNADPKNHIDSCRTCNLRKGPRTPKEWYDSLTEDGA